MINHDVTGARAPTRPAYWQALVLFAPLGLLLAAPSAMAQTATPAPVAATPAAANAAALIAAEQQGRVAAQAQLGESLARVAADSSDWDALSRAGRAALVLGDPRAALGFLARAEALAPRDPVIKAALGAAMVQLEDPTQAIRYFDSAIAMGGLDRTYMADRGLAYDLLGDQRRAQADYSVAMQATPSAEVIRRHAVSLGISGQADQAIVMLAPLLRAQDRAAWRSRALILAMNGRAEEARQIARATMPAELAQGLDPYFALMDHLTPQQLAAASHFGRFPSYDMVRNQPSRSATRLASANTQAAPTRSRRESRRESRRNRQETQVATNSVTPPANTVPISAAPPPGAMPATPAPTAPRVITPTPGPVVVATATPTPAPVPPAVQVRAAAPNPVPSPAITPAPSSTTFPPQTPASQTVAPQSPPSQTPAVAVPALMPTPGPAPTPTATTPPVVPVSTPTPAPVPTPSPTPQLVTQPAVQPTATATPSPSAATPPAAIAISGPPDNGAPPAVVAAPAAQTTALLAPAAAVPVPQPAAPAAGTTVVAGWSLDNMIASIDVSEAERNASAGAVSMQEMDAIVAERRRAQAAAAAQARQQAQADARARAASQEEARKKAEEEAAERAEAERLRRNPARIWVQIATGSNANALAFDCRRFTRQYPEVFRNQSCSTAAWNRTRRLLVGPFRNQNAARDWLAQFSRAGGNGFVWSSEAGEEVTAAGGR